MLHLVCILYLITRFGLAYMTVRSSGTLEFAKSATLTSMARRTSTERQPDSCNFTDEYIRLIYTLTNNY